MIYKTASDWMNAPQKRVLLFGMSGLGKTHVSNMLSAGGWFHYSVDHRIGDHYMGDLVDRPVSINDLSPVADYLGKPGNPALGGLTIAEYTRRQSQFEAAERAALADTADIIAAHPAQNFICDTGGSICEWVTDPAANDPMLRDLAENCLLVWIKGDAAHTNRLVKRFDAAPKPMTYRADFMTSSWHKYLIENNCLEGDVDPDNFIRSTFANAMAHRQPLYADMAKSGVTVSAEDVGNLTSPADFERLIADALEMRAANT